MNTIRTQAPFSPMFSYTGPTQVPLGVKLVWEGVLRKVGHPVEAPWEISLDHPLRREIPQAFDLPYLAEASIIDAVQILNNYCSKADRI